jgi:aryl-alcohol dehydrogenase-like predicted oxidoreductase
MIAKHPFGRTGHMSSRVLLGAAAFWDLPQADADASIELALASGVNHFDVAASYGNAEIYLGDWIKRHGRPSFLATKTEERTADKAYDSIRRSLERLHVDHVDMIQLHNLIEPNEWQTAMGPGGALDAAVRAREEGLVRFIGVTGHGLTAAAQHTRALERFDFDSVLLPYSYLMWMNVQYRSDFLNLLDICKKRSVAVQTIKSLVHTPWGEREHTRNTWYRPLEDQVDIDLAVHWVLGNDGLFLNSAGDIHILPKVLDAASRFERKPEDEVMQAMVERLEMQNLFVE